MGLVRGLAGIGAVACLAGMASPAGAYWYGSYYAPPPYVVPYAPPRVVYVPPPVYAAPPYYPVTPAYVAPRLASHAAWPRTPRRARTAAVPAHAAAQACKPAVAVPAFAPGPALGPASPPALAPAPAPGAPAKNAYPPEREFIPFTGD